MMHTWIYRVLGYGECEAVQDGEVAVRLCLAPKYPTNRMYTSHLVSYSNEGLRITGVGLEFTRKYRA